MRILHLILSQGFAGSERYAAELANVQAAQHTVMLMVRSRHRGRGGASILDAVSDAVTVQTVPDRWGTQRAVERGIARWQPDVIHTHLRRSARIVARAGSPAPSIATLHIRANGRHFFRLDGLICNAQWQVREIPASYHGRVFKLNQLFTPHRQLPAAEVVQLRRSLGVHPEQFLIGAVARLAHSKGLDTLMRAFRAAALPQARLVILGEGRERRRLDRLSGPEVALPGFRHDVKDYYQAFDLFVCPSRREPLPLVMLEAYDAGVPVVASSAEGCRELVEENGGELFPIGDEAALAAILRRRHAGARERIHPDLRPHYIESVNRTIVTAYETLIADRGRRPVPEATAAAGRAGIGSAGRMAP
jgi:glycosyltransferase involved in cell wall biosynthesis